jgi:hypothetical protein
MTQGAQARYLYWFTVQIYLADKHSWFFEKFEIKSPFFLT